jgi:potassium-dependent mechanosensitive channel
MRSILANLAFSRSWLPRGSFSASTGSTGVRPYPARFLLFLIACAVASGTTGHSLAALGDRETTKQTVGDLQQERQRLTAQSAILKTADKSEVADQLEALFLSIDAIYGQLQAHLDEMRQIDEDKKKVEHAIDALDKFGPDDPKPYSFLLLDQLRDQRALAEDEERTLKAEVKSAEKILQTVHEDQDKTDRVTPKGPVSAAANQGKVAPAAEKLMSRDEAQQLLAKATVALKQADVELQNRRLELCQLRQRFLSKKIDAIQATAVFSPRDRDAQLGVFVEKESQLRRQLRETENHLQQLPSAKQENDKKHTAGKEGESAQAATADAWRVASEAYQLEVVLLDQQVDNVATLRRWWRRRFELANDKVDATKVSQWLDELDEFLDQLGDMARSLEYRRDAARDSQAAHTKATAAAEAADPQSHELRQVSLQGLRDLCAEQLADVRVAERWLQRFRDELKKESATSGGNLGPLSESFNAFWTYPVAGDEKESVTLGTLLVLAVYIVAGIVTAYALSRIVFRRILPRLGVHRGTASALRSILFYSLCAVFGVLAFRLLHIPLAAFAFLGGAAAIAVGFGSQDIMNNFMSGVILLTEQPIRVGDFVRIEGSEGIVQHIGLRSTRIQTESNHELIVPNKALIDEQVTNLTLSDNLVQMWVAATVERNVKIEQAKWDMLEIAFSHPMVVKSPRPFVLLKEVDTYWLVFEVHFWLQHSSFVRSALVQSEILEVIGDHYQPPEEADTSSNATTGQDDNSVDATDATTLARIQRMSDETAAKAIKRARSSVRLR